MQKIKNIFTFMRDCAKGKRSLAQAFWKGLLVWFGFLIFYAFLVGITGAGIVRMHFVEGGDKDFIQGIINILLFPVNLWFFLAVLKCSSNVKHKILGYVAIIFALIFLVRTSIILYEKIVYMFDYVKTCEIKDNANQIRCSGIRGEK